MPLTREFHHESVVNCVLELFFVFLFRHYLSSFRVLRLVFMNRDIFGKEPEMRLKCCPRPEQLRQLLVYIALLGYSKFGAQNLSFARFKILVSYSSPRPGRYPRALPGAGAVIQSTMGRRPGLARRAIGTITNIDRFISVLFSKLL